MPGMSRVNSIGFAVLGAASLGLCAYALLRPTAAPMALPPQEPTPAGADVEGPSASVSTVPLPAAPPSSPAAVSSLRQQAAAPAAPPPVPAALVAALESLRGWAGNGFNNADPRFGPVADAVRGQVPDALRHWRASQGDGYADEAMARAIVLALDVGDRDTVIAALDEAPWLARTLVERGWAAAAHDAVRVRLADGDRRLPPYALDWALALAESATAADHPVLARVLSRLGSDGDQAALAERMRALPGCDWADTVRRAWALRAASPIGAGDGNRRWTALAAQAGVEEAFLALGVAVNSERARLRTWLLAQPAVGGREPDEAWFAAARGRLSFVDGSWRLRSAEAPAPAAPVARTPGVRRPLPPPKADPPVPLPPAGLAADADAAAVAAWIEGQLAAVADLREISWKNPVVDRLAAVPPRHFAELVKALDRHEKRRVTPHFLAYAIERAARQEHRDLLIANVARCPGLAEYVVAHDWADAAAPGLRQILTTERQSHLLAAVCAVEGLARHGDPADADLLRKTLVSSEFGYWQARMATALQDMPGFDLDAAVRQAWRAFPRADYGDKQEAFCIHAARAGIREGLEIAVLHASGGNVTWKSGTLAASARTYLAETFQVEADPAAIAAWWSAAKDAVQWDPVLRRWTGPRPVAPAASPTGGNF